MTFEYIFWDNDGVLVDTEKYYYQASREALAEVGIELSSKNFTEISLRRGASVFELASKAGINETQIASLRVFRDQRYSQLLALKDLTLPGVRETLMKLSGRLGMAIVTSSRKEHFEIIHRNSHLLRYFDFILTREDFIKTKPDPEPYHLALINSRKPADRCLVIEDSPRGIAAAKAAGLTCWALPSDQTAGEDFTQADRILSSIQDLPGLLI